MIAEANRSRKAILTYINDTIPTCGDIMQNLPIFPDLPVTAHNGGLFISQGRGSHIERVIGTYELIFVREGILSMHEEDTPFEIHAGQTLLLWRGKRHGGTAPYPADLQFYWVHFDAKESQGSDAAMVPQQATVSRPDFFTMLFRTFLENQGSDQGSQLTADLLLTLMLAEIANANKQVCSTTTAPKLRLAVRANTFIRFHSDKPISTSDVAQGLDVSADYLGRVFRKAYGKTITEAIQENRIKRAKSLLMETDEPIDRISSACGFENPSFFRRVFQRHTGLSPAKYRRLYCRIHINTE